MLALLVALGACGSGETNPIEISEDEYRVAVDRVNAAIPIANDPVASEEVLADARTFCAVMLEIPGMTTDADAAFAIMEPQYAAAVDAGLPDTDEFDAERFAAIELPYLVSLGQQFCPSAAVAANFF